MTFFDAHAERGLAELNEKMCAELEVRSTWQQRPPSPFLPAAPEQCAILCRWQGDLFKSLYEWPELNKEDDEWPESCAHDDSLSTALPANKR